MLSSGVDFRLFAGRLGLLVLWFELCFLFCFLHLNLLLLGFLFGVCVGWGDWFEFC